MANDPDSDVRDTNHDDDSSKAEGKEGSGAQVGALVRAELMGLASVIADARMAVSAAGLDKHPATPALVPYSMEDRLQLLENDRDALIEGVYWGVGILVFLFLLASMRR